MTRLASAHDERGASAVEYGLLISGVAAVIVAAVFLFGGSVGVSFNNSCDVISGQVNASTC